MNKYISISLAVLGIGSGLGAISWINHAQAIMGNKKIDRPAIISTAEGLKLSYERGLGDTTKARTERERILATQEYNSAKTAYENALMSRDSQSNPVYTIGGLYGLSLICLAGGLVAGFKQKDE